jgi:hypothetical protein
MIVGKNPLAPDPSPFEVEIAIAKSEIHKLIHSTGNKNELPDQ